MNRLHILCFLSAILFPEVTKLRAQDYEPYIQNLDRFRIVFPHGEPGGCEPGEFERKSRNLYKYTQYISEYFSDPFKITEATEKFDSLVVHDRYVNCMAMLYSETEGVRPFDQEESGLPKDKVYYVSKWNRIEPKKGVYSFEHYAPDETYWKPVCTGIDTTAFNTWYDRLVTDGQIPGDWGDRRIVFCYQRALRITLYTGKSKTIVYLIFDHRKGEC